MNEQRQVVRTATCQHPGISDAEVLALWELHGTQAVLHCEARLGNGYPCGYWYLRSDDDDNVVLIDEPVGAGL